MVIILASDRNLRMLVYEAVNMGCEASLFESFSSLLDDFHAYIEVCDLVIAYPKFGFAPPDRTTFLEGLERFRKESGAPVVFIIDLYTNTHFWKHVDAIKDTTLIASVDELPETVKNILKRKEEAIVH